MKRYLGLVVASLIMIQSVGCIENQEVGKVKPFDETELEAVLGVAIDFSGSFSTLWDEKAYAMFLKLISEYMTEENGAESRVVLGQISGSGKTVIFEGRPNELKKKFRSPAEFGNFLREHADPAGSRVYQSVTDMVTHLSQMHGVTENTRLLVVVMSDCVDSEPEKEEWRAKGNKMLSALKSFRERGGCIAMYYVSEQEITRWQKIFSKTGFEPGNFLIETHLAENPRLPTFY